MDFSDDVKCFGCAVYLSLLKSVSNKVSRENSREQKLMKFCMGTFEQSQTSRDT